MQMSPVLVAIIGLLLLIFLFAGMHIGIAMALVGFLGIMYMRIAGGFEAGKAFMMALGAFTNGPFASTNKDSLVVIPMFTLMGVTCARAGISQDLYAAVKNGGDIYAPSDAFAAQLATAYDNVAAAWIAEQADPAVAQRIYDQAKELVGKYNAQFNW